MKTIRRIYFYLVVAISVEVLLWGLINLLRSIFSGGLLADTTQTLSIGLAQIVVSIPIFLIHWNVIKKDAGKSEEELTSHIRAMFFFGILLGTLIPVVQNILAVVNRLVLDTARVSRMTAIVGSSQSTSDNLIAIGLNLILAYYFYLILQSDRKVSPHQTNLVDVKRVYRYIWMVYGLAMSIMGVDGLIQFSFRQTRTIDPNAASGLINSITLLILGVPIWVVAWTGIQKTIGEWNERHSLWRVVLFYIMNLGFAGTVFGTGIALFSRILKSLLNLPAADAPIWFDLRTILAAFIPFLVLWVYYLRHFYADIEDISDQLTRQGMYRLYRYILAFVSLGGTTLSIMRLISYVIDMLMLHDAYFTGNLDQLSLSIASLAVSVLFWLYFYLPENKIAAAMDEFGEHARRSIIRKIYLYAAIFSGVVGVMISGGMTVYLILQNLLTGNDIGSWDQVVKSSQQIVVFGFLLGYHLSLLRQDGKSATTTLQSKMEACKVWIAASSESALAKAIINKTSRQAPGIQIDFHESVPTDGIPTDIQAVVLPGNELTGLNSAWQNALHSYRGRVMVMPEKVGKWVWLNPIQNDSELATTVTNTLRQLAEGQPIQVKKQGSAWMILGYIIGAFLLLNILSVIFSMFFGMQ